MSQERTVLLPFQLLHTSATSRRFLERILNGRWLKGIDCVDQGRTWAIDWEVCFNSFCWVRNSLYLWFMHFCFCHFLMEVPSRPFLGFAMQPRLPINSGSFCHCLWHGRMARSAAPHAGSKQLPQNPGNSDRLIWEIFDDLENYHLLSGLVLLIAVCLWKIKFNSCPLSISRALQIKVWCRQQIFLLFFFFQAVRFRLQHASTLTNLALLEVAWAVCKRMGGDRILLQRGDRLVQASSLLYMKGAHPEPPSVPPWPRTHASPTLAAPATLFVTRYWQRNQHQKMGLSQIVSVGLSPVALKLKSGWVAPFL